MNEVKERRADYIDLAEIKTDLKNIIIMFDRHLADDKETVKRINKHDTSIARIYGGIAVLGLIIGCVLKGLKW